MNYILDTNVISQLVARKPDLHVLHWLESIPPEQIFLSVITLGELQKGMEKLPTSARKTELLAWLEHDLLSRFRDHLLSVDVPVMLTWGSLTARLEAAGRPIPAIDSLLAATALVYGCTLVTRNIKDFAATGILVLDPWQFRGKDS